MADAGIDSLLLREKQFGVTETAAPPVPASTVPDQFSQAPARVKALSEAGVKLAPTAEINRSNNNPGNIKLTSGAYAAYPTKEAGIAAIGDWLDRAQSSHGLTTIRQLIDDPVHGYAPSSDPGNVGKNLSEAAARVVGVDPDKPIDMADPVMRAKMVDAILKQEQGGASQVQQKRVGSMEDLKALEAQNLHGVPSQDYADEQPDEMFVDPIDQAPSDTSEETSALLAGAARGSAGLVIGPTQMVLEQAAPDAAVQFTNQINDWEERLGMLEATRRHPVWSSVGEVAGTVAGVMATAGMLGETAAGEAIGKVASYVPKLLRGVAVGAVAGATTFHQDIEEGNRWLEGVLGAVFGGVGQTIGSTLGWGSRYLANREAFNKYLAVLQGSVGEWSRNLGGIKDAFLEHYRRLTEESNRLYEVRNQSGQAFPGFDADRLSQAVSAAIPKEAREAGVATTVTTNKVKDELGLYRHEAEKKTHAEAVREWEKAEEKWHKAARNASPINLDTASHAAREKVIQELAHVLPPRPLPPGEFVPKPVAANRFAAALQAVHRAREAAREPQTRHQLSTLERELFNAAKEAARQHGMPMEQFLRDMVRANKFFAENIGPIRDMFGKMGPDRVARKFTNAEMADRVAAVLKKNDVGLMEKLGKALGPKARVEATKVVMKEVLDRTTEGMKGQVPTREAVQRMSKYVADRKEGLQAMLGRQHVEELEGFAKLGEQLMTARPRSRLWGWGTHSFLPFIGTEQVFEGLWEGDLHKVQRGTALIAAPFAVHALHDTFIKMYSLPYMLPMVRAAAKLKPGSAEMDKLVRQIEARAIGVGSIVGREIPQAVDTLTEAP